MPKPNPIAPEKGGFVPGHRAIVFTRRHWLTADVIEASARRVIVKFDTTASVIFGMGKTRAFTWRRSVGRYVDEADKRSKKGACLALDQRPKSEIEPIH